MIKTATVATEPFALPDKSVRRVKFAARSIRAKYQIIDAANDLDFNHICEGEEIQVLRVGTNHRGFALKARNHEKISDGSYIVFGKLRKFVSLRKKFYFVGALVIPSMHNAKKLIAGEIEEIELQTKHAECELFAALMLKREVARNG